MRIPREFSWRDAANLMFVVGALPLLLLAALRGELARRRQDILGWQIPKRSAD